MPFTPLHFGPPLFLMAFFLINNRHLPFNFWKKTNLYWIAVLIGSISPDIQGLISVTINHNIKLHGFSHTLIGSIFYASAFLVIFIAIKWKLLEMNSADYWLENIKIDLEGTKLRNLFLVHWLSILIFHLLPDMLIYRDMAIFWPISNNNFMYYSYNEMAGFMFGFWMFAIFFTLYYYIKNNIKIEE